MANRSKIHSRSRYHRSFRAVEKGSSRWIRYSTDNASTRFFLRGSLIPMAGKVRRARSSEEREVEELYAELPQVVVQVLVEERVPLVSLERSE